MENSSKYMKMESDDTDGIIPDQKSCNENTNSFESPKTESETVKKNEKKEDDEDTLPPVGFFSLFRYSSGCDRALLTVAVFIAILSGTSMPAVMIIFGAVIDKYIGFDLTRKNMTNNTITKEELLSETATLCMYNGIFAFVYFIGNYLMVCCLGIAAENQAFRIRCLFMKSVLKQDIPWYDTSQTGDFASRITEDLSRIQDGIGEKVGICISYIASCVFCVGCGLYFGWQLALVILCVTPLFTLSIAIFSKIQASASREELEAYGKAGSVAEEVLSSIRTVVSFGGERKEIKRYETCLKPAKKKSIRRGLLTGVGAALGWFCIFGGYSLAFWYGVKLIVEEQGELHPQYTGGTLIVVFFNVMSASMFIGQTAPFFEAFALARGAAAKIFSIIDRKPVIDSSSEDGNRPDSVEGCLNLNKVHFSYPSRRTVPVLQDLSLTVKPGQTVALVGASGCGKSTVIQLILRFYDVDNGTVELDGLNVKELNVGWLRDQIGIVGQEPVLFATTIGKNIRYGKLDASEDEIIMAAKIANIHDFIESLPLKYNTLVGGRGTQLSGGQKQRIAIARAMIKNPRILLLDEATSALDTESEAVVQAALDEARLGRTTIVVAHRLSTIRNADKIVVLEGGQIKEEGTHDELMKRKGSYYELVLNQTKESEAEKEDSDSDDDLNEDSNLTKRKTSVVSSASGNSEEVRAELRRQISASSNEAERQAMSSSNLIHRQSSVISEHTEGHFMSTSGKHAPDQTDAEKEETVSQIHVLKMLAPEWFYIFIGILSSVLMGLHFPLFGIIFGSILGVLSEEPSSISKQNAFYCLIFLLMAITSFITTFLQIFMFSVAGEKFTYRLRKLVFANIITQDISFFDDPKNSVGSICSRLTSDASSIQAATGSRIGTLFRAISTLSAAVAIGLIYNLKIGSVVLAYIPLILFAHIFESRVVRRHTESEKSGLETASKVAIECIENIRTVASLHRERMFYYQFEEALLKPHRESRLKSHVRGLSYGFAQAIQSFAYATSLYYGSVLVGRGELNYSDLLKVIEGVIIGASSAAQAVAFTPEYQKAKVAAARMIKLLEIKPEIDAFSDQGMIKDDVKGYIGFKKVHFNYPSRKKVKVLRGLNLEIEPGQTVALVGSSGCGKSTCVQLIERFYDVQHGKVLIDEENIKDLNVADHRSHVGLVSQEPVLFSYSIAENIAYGDNTRNMDMNEIIEVARQANIHNFIASLPQGYDTPVGDKGTQLSGGQKQRVAIARALLRNPKFLLLDEATSALDAESEKIVQEALDKARSGRTCLIIAHRLTTIQNADCIMVIHKGRIVEKGTHQELINKKGYYYNLHNTQTTAQ